MKKILRIMILSTTIGIFSWNFTGFKQDIIKNTNLDDFNSEIITDTDDVSRHCFPGGHEGGGGGGGPSNTGSFYNGN